MPRVTCPSNSFPTLTSFEKSGSFVNRGFFCRSFEQAVPGPAGLLPDVHVLARLVKELTGQEEVANDLDSIWKEMVRSSTSCFKGFRFPIPRRMVLIGWFQVGRSSFCRTKGSSLRAHCEAQGRLIMDFDPETLQLLGLERLSLPFSWWVRS